MCGSPVNRPLSAARPISIVPERKARHSPDNRSDRAVLTHVPETRPKHDTSYLYSGHVGPFGPSCTHLARCAMNNPLIKKAVKYFSFTGIFEPTEYDDHNI
jgi:hypothetical protein